MSDCPVFAQAAVAAPHALAAEAGRMVLAEGGNAVDAMLAMAASIAVVYPHMNAIGGDGFWLVREPGGAVHAIEACGPAAALATRDRYVRQGYEAIPPRGPEAIVTAPGAVGGWSVARQLAAALGRRTGRGGSLPLSLLLGPAIGHAKAGYPVSPSEERGFHNEREALFAAPGFAAAFTVDGAIPKAGTLRTQPALAATLEHLAGAGLDDFYRGDVGREIGSDLEALDAPLRRADLERYEARVVQPLSAAASGATLFNMPPPTQGLASLIIMGLFSRLGVTRADSFEHVHGLIEATKRAFRVRDAVVTDPGRLPRDPWSFLDAGWLDREAQRISMREAAHFPIAWGEGDTVWMGAMDADGTAVSYIQSIYWEYGSGCVLPRTGIHLQNRGISFSLDPKALNALEPGRRPFHTLTPALAAFGDGRTAVYGSMGGDGQPQFQTAVLTRYLLGRDALAAVDAPRWLLGRTWGSSTTSLRFEGRTDPDLLRDLERAGHMIDRVHAPYAELFGHAGLIVRDPRNGSVAAAHDPRSDGGAAGL